MEQHEYIDRMFIDFEGVTFANVGRNRFGVSQVFLELRRVRDKQRLAWLSRADEKTITHPVTKRTKIRPAETNGRFVCRLKQAPPGLRLPGTRVEMYGGDELEIVQIGRFIGPPQRWKVGGFSLGKRAEAIKE